MTQKIHPTAIIEDGATIGDNVTIGPYCIISANTTLGDDVTLKSHVVIDGHTTIGEGTIIYPFASLGSAPQDLKFGGETSKLVIGKNNTIREHVTMNPGTETGRMETTIGDNCLFMMATHVAHDCIVGNNVIMANNATLAGHVEVGDFAIIGGLSAVLQFNRIGEHAIIGGMSGVESDIIPYGRVRAERAKLQGLNLIGMQRRGFDKTQVKHVQSVYKKLFAEDGTLDERIAKIKTEDGEHEVTQQILDFISGDSTENNPKLPLCQPAK